MPKANHLLIGGARAIFYPKQKNPIDLLHDRQTFSPEGVHAPRLLHWLNTVGLPWLRLEVKNVSPMSAEVFTHSDEGYTIIASPNASSGYLYIGCYYHNPPGMCYEMQAMPDSVITIGDDLPKFEPGFIYFSGEKIPAKGDRVRINFNKLGAGVVVDYFVEHQWLGVRVKLDKQPEWHLKNNGNYPYALVFGCELESK